MRRTTRSIIVGCAAAAAAILFVASAPAAESLTDTLLKNLGSDKVQVSSSAAQTLGELYAAADGQPVREGRQRVVKALLAKLTAGGEAAWPVRKACAEALGRVKAAEAVPALKAAWDGTHIELAIGATHALVQILSAEEMGELARKRLTGAGASQAAAARYLSTVATAADEDLLAAGLEAEEWRTRKHCAAGLGAIVRRGGKLSAKTCERLAGLLGGTVLNVVEAAQATLAAAGSPEAVAALGKAATTTGDGSRLDTTWRLRVAAIKTLGRIRMPRIQSALPAVVAGLGDETVNVIKVSKQVLARVPANRRYPLLLGALKRSTSDRVKAGIIEALSAGVPAKHKAEAATLALAALKAAGAGPGGARLRAAAIHLLGASGRADAAEEIAKGLTSEVVVIRRAAGAALAKLKLSAEQNEKIARMLIPTLQGEDWRAALAATLALRTVPAKAAVKSLVLSGLGHRVLNVQEAAAGTLTEYGKHAELKKAIETLLLAQGENPATWEQGAALLGRLKTEGAAPLLLKMIVADGGKDHWRVQVNAARALGQVGVKNDDVKAALLTCTQSSVVQVRNAANQALRTLWKQ